MGQPKLSVVHIDSFANMASGLGTITRDKREAAFAQYTNYRPEEMEDLYAQDGLAGIICDAKGEDMFREGYSFNFPDSSTSGSESDDLKGDLDLIEAEPTAIEALAMARCSGGSVIILGVDDGVSNPALPLREDKVRSVDYLKVLTRSSIRPFRAYGNVSDPRYGEVEIYEIQNADTSSTSILGPNGGSIAGNGTLIHESRLIRVDGFRLPNRIRRKRDGWGGSILERCYTVLRDYEMSWASISLLMQELGMLQLKVKNLAQLVNAGNNAAVVGRAQQIAFAKSTARAIVTDAEESAERVDINWSGVPEVQQQAALRISSVARTPLSRLMGQAATGLNATGEGDMRNWYDYVRAGQKYEARPIIERIASLVLRARGEDPEQMSWWLDWKPLETMSDKERSEIQVNLSQADKNWVEAGITFPDEVAVSRFGGESIGYDIRLDDKARKVFEDSNNVADPKALIAGGDPAPVDPLAVDPSTALNGAQVASMVDIVTRVGTGELPRDSGIEMLISAFPINRAQAEKIMGSVGNGFRIEKAQPADPVGASPNGNAQ